MTGVVSLSYTAFKKPNPMVTSSHRQLNEDLQAPKQRGRKPTGLWGSSDSSVFLGYRGGGGGERADGNICSFCLLSPSLVLTSGPLCLYSQHKSF